MSRTTAAACAVLLLIVPASAIAQTDSTTTFPRSIGLTDPDNTSDLMDYRLPDWSWYTWDVRLNMNASGAQNEIADQDRWTSELLSRYRRFRESEDHQWDVFAVVEGTGFGRSSSLDEPLGSGDTELDTRRLAAAAQVGGSSLNYLSRRFGVRLGGSVRADYQELRIEGDVTPVTGSEGRSLAGAVRPGFSFGRIRNVDPLLRAKRVSERLVALGRPPIESQELRALAARIAQQGGYTSVFDRSQKYFWADLLEEFTVGNELSAQELLYLLEVFEEAYGLRFQGLRLDAEVELSRRSSSGSGVSNSGTNLYRPFVAGSWFHNFNLENQIRVEARWSYTEARSDDGDRGAARESVARLGHLLLLTDRWRWKNELIGARTASQNANGGDWSGQWNANFTSNLVVFIEDRLSLVPSVTVQYRSYDGDLSQDRPEEWSWIASLALEYQIGQGIY
jgi:hypothetical protein